MKSASKDPWVSWKSKYWKSKSAPVLTFFVTKGGVMKTTLTLNMARQAALNGLKTLVIGLDLQCDLSRTLGAFGNEAEAESLSDYLRQVDEVSGLYQYFMGQVSLKELVTSTDLENLFFISETPELASLEKALSLRPRREYWLKEAVVDRLSKDFDLILFDAPPSWNLLITNALVASHTLVSPVECRINNYRNLKMFLGFIGEFRSDLKLKFQHLFVPTRYQKTRRLCHDIFVKYQQELTNCLPTPVRESVVGEEAMALGLSLPEYKPSSVQAKEIRLVLNEIWHRSIQPKPTKTRWLPRSKETEYGAQA